MILASHGIIASQIASFDADALAFFQRVSDATGTLSLTEKQAVNQLVLDLKANSLWTPMKAIYPMVGASAAACAQNLKSSSFTGTFSSGWTFASTGVTGNGTSAYFDTNCNLSTTLTPNNAHLSFYSRTNINQNTWEISVNDTLAKAYNPEYGLRMQRLDNKMAANMGSYLTQSIDIVLTNSLGFGISSRTSNSSFKMYKNASLLVSNSVIDALSNNYPNFKVFIGATNFGGSASGFSNKQCAFASIGDGLTDTQASNFYTAVQAFQTTLSRNV
jgi:hypothetical protein